MTLTHNIILVLFFCITSTWARSEVDFESNNLNAINHGVKLLEDNDGYFTSVKNNQRVHEKVRIQIYYESLSIDCVNFILFSDFLPTMVVLWPYLDIKMYPFGNAKVIDRDGNPDFICLHGPEECYGNKLHACAIDNLGYSTRIEYIICLLEDKNGLGSDDESADRCGKNMNINSEPIKECAKGTRGTELLLYYGEESKKANFSYVPHVLINGKMCNTNDREFVKHVCVAFTNPPPLCKYYNMH